MARRKKVLKEIRNLSAAQYRYVVEKATHDGKLAWKDVQRYIADLPDEVRRIQERLAELTGHAAARIKRAARDVEVPAPARRMIKKGRKRVKRAISEARRASQQLQGQYLGYMRQIAKTGRAKFKKIAESEGREKAIEAMKKALGR
jgi:hypothetical protein